jgi:hypothetical protein
MKERNSVTVRNETIHVVLFSLFCCSAQMSLFHEMRHQQVKFLKKWMNWKTGN